MADVGYVTRIARQLSAGLAERLGIPEPAEAWRAFYAQVANETAVGDPSTIGVRNRNPLNLKALGPSVNWYGQVGTDEQGFAIFESEQAGVKAEVQNYLAPNYAGVVEAFKVGDVGSLVSAIERSPWDAGHYGDTLENFLPGGSAAPTVADNDCPLGQVKTVFGTCAAPGHNSAGELQKDFGVNLNPFDALGKSIEDFQRTVATGTRQIAVAGVIIGAVVILGYAGVKQIVD